MNENIKDIITELDRIEGLIDRFISLGRQAEALEQKNKQDLAMVYSEYHPELPSAPPVFTALEPLVEPFRSSYTGSLKISLIGFLAGLAAWGISTLANLYGIYGFAVLATLIFGIWFFRTNGKVNKERKDHKAREERRQKFEEIIKGSHAQDLIKFKDALNDYSAQYSLYTHKFVECHDAYVNEHNALVEQSDEVQRLLSEVTLLSQDHILLAARIGSILKSGRADTLKEALNLAIAEKRDEEFRAQQLAEEARRTEIAEQQAYENRLHNQRMEQEAAAQTMQAQTQAQIAQAQLKATQQQNAQLQKIIDNQNKR
jgi:hypothetical protein